MAGFDSTQVTMKNDGQDMMYAAEQLGMISLEGITPFEGFVSFPSGVYALEANGIEIGDRETNAGVTHLVVSFKFTVLNMQPKDAGINPQEFIGKDYIENIWIIDGERDFGKVKAIIMNSGFSAGNALLQEECARWGASKHRMLARLVQTADRNNKDRKFTNMDYTRGSIAPLAQQQQQEAQAAQQAAQGGPSSVPPTPPPPPPQVG